MSDASLASTLGVVGVVAVLALGPVPELALVLQLAGAGGLVGVAVAYRARQRSYGLDSWVITARWTLAGGGFGVVALVLLALL